MTQSELDRQREERLRRQAARLGWFLRKSRVQEPHFDDMGGWMICDLEHNAVVHGSRLELDLDDVAEWLGEAEAARGRPTASAPD